MRPLDWHHVVALQDAPGAIKGNVQPGRSVHQFVFHFVEGFLEQEEIEQVPRLRGIGRPQRRIGGGAAGVPEFLGRLFAPDFELRRRGCALLRREIDRVGQRRGGRIVDRADQPGDVARRRRLRAPLGERAARLALEVEDERVVLGDQHLAEMEVAVMADLHRVDRARQRMPDMRRRSPLARGSIRSTSACSASPRPPRFSASRSKI